MRAHPAPCREIATWFDETPDDDGLGHILLKRVQSAPGKDLCYPEAIKEGVRHQLGPEGAGKGCRDTL